MKIAYVTSSKRGETDRLLSEVARNLRSKERHLVGVVRAMDYESHYENGCDMKLLVLPAGPEIKITQNLGDGSDACRLDPSAIAHAVVCVENGEMAPADLFILNKFGPEETRGHGFVSAIEQALENETPVLVGVSAASKGAFDFFADGLAERLPDDLDAILNWCDANVSAQSARSASQLNA